MLSETLARSLADYAIGTKVRRLRKDRSMGIVELASHTGLSPAMISKIENGRLVPTLPTLMRIALVFSVGLEFFFRAAEDNPTFEVMRAGERLRLPERTGNDAPAYDFESLDYAAVERPFNVFLAVFHEVDDAMLHRHSHAGVELLYVVRGKLELRHGGHSSELAAGDSVYFDASVAHGYRRLGRSPCQAVIVTA